MLLCGEIDSYPYKNKDYGPIFSVAEVPLNDIVTVARCVLCFSQKGTFLFPVSSLVLHVHVVLSHMYMSYRFTCTSKTTLHTEASYVTLRDRTLSIPEKEIDAANSTEVMILFFII